MLLLSRPGRISSRPMSAPSSLISRSQGSPAHGGLPASSKPEGYQRPEVAHGMPAPWRTCWRGYRQPRDQTRWAVTRALSGQGRWAVKGCPAKAPLRPEEVLLLVRGAREDGKLAGPSLMRRGAA